MASAHANKFDAMDPAVYQERIRAWTLYDWGNSAFATTILAAVLPTYYSSVAGSTLPSEASATAYWSIGLSLSLFIIAILSPILGTISDVMRGKKRFLSVFAGIGIVATGLMVLVGSGDWFLASILFVLGRIGFSGSIVFYDSLLPHIARTEDQDIVSTRGYAMGYLGGGLLLAINVAMIQLIPDSLFEFAGIRLTFLSVAIWWAVFTIPLLRKVPEPEASGPARKAGQGVISASFGRLKETFGEIRQYQELFKYLVAFLIYNDAIGTIIGVAVIYGAELGFGTLELVLALLLVQFAGIPFSLIFGRLPSRTDQRRSFYLAFICFNLVALPIVGIGLSKVLPADLIGTKPANILSIEQDNLNFLGEGVYSASDFESQSTGYEGVTVKGDQLAGNNALAFLVGAPEDVEYLSASATGSRLDIPLNAKRVQIVYSIGPDQGKWLVEVDQQPLMIEEDGVEKPLEIDTYNETVRYGVSKIIELGDTVEAQTLSLITAEDKNPDSSGYHTGLASVEVKELPRQNNLLAILGILIGIQLVGLIFAFLTQKLFRGLADSLNTQRSILLSLVIYAVIALWGFFIDSTIEFWLLAWMVATVQGGSQALSRSLYASMSPASKSGEFFGLYGVMEKFSAIIGPLIFAGAVAIFGTSRPAIVSLILFFIIGGFLLMRVNVAEGQRVAREEDMRSA